jgi:carboxyl-terminal processing protease
MNLLQKKFIIPVVASAFLYCASFKDDFLKLPSKLRFHYSFKELNRNYVDETNPGDLMDKAIKGMLQPRSVHRLF